MGQRGPRAKHPALKLLAGIPGKRPAGIPGKAQGRAKRGKPKKPDGLAGEAAAEWDRIVPELHRAGWLSVVDRAGLTAYCLAWDQMVWADGVLKVEGCIVEVPIQSARGDVIGHDHRPHPAVKIQADASRRVLAFISEFGLTPASRGRLEGPAPEAAPKGNQVDALRERISQARAAGPT